MPAGGATRRGNGTGASATPVATSLAPARRPSVSRPLAIEWLMNGLLLLAVWAAIANPLGAGSADPGSATPTLSLSPATGTIGTIVHVSGANFGHTSVTLTWDGSPTGMPAVQAAGNGSFKATLVVPAGATVGPHSVAGAAAGPTPAWTMAGGGNNNKKPTGNPPPTLSAFVLFTTSVLNVAASPMPIAPSTTPAPTATVTSTPSSAPTAVPPTATPGATLAPTTSPTATTVPTTAPTLAPPTATPGTTAAPTTASNPTAVPTAAAPTASPAVTLAPTTAPTTAPVLARQPAGFVTRSGTKLVANGQPYRFAGLNIYNANSDWSVNGGCAGQMGGTALQGSLTAIGPGQGVFRAWFFQYLATNRSTLSRDWSAFDLTLAVAAGNSQKVIATLGNQWGDCEEQPGSTYKTEAWYRGGYKSTPMNPQVKASYYDWVKEVVSRYKNNPTILVWQLMNEAEIGKDPYPSGCGSATSLKSFADDVAGVIKSIDPSHLVSLGTMGGPQGCGYAGADYTLVHSGPNIDLCEYHDYGDSSPLPAGLLQRIDQCNALNKPMLVGEVQTWGYASVATRAAAIDAKMAAQFSAGVVGFLPWDWTANGSDLANGSIGPGDPVLAVLGKY